MLGMTLSSRHRIRKFEHWRSEAEHATSLISPVLSYITPFTNTKINAKYGQLESCGTWLQITKHLRHPQPGTKGHMGWG